MVDSLSAFQRDPKLDAVMVISPDAMTLTSGGKIGSGAEGSVNGARILLSTKTASRVIADVYAVRKDYFDTHRNYIEKFVHALMLGQERLQEMLRNKNTQQAKYNQLLSKSATLLMGSPQATADVEGLLGDCEFVDHAGNVAFFTGKGTTRTLASLTDEIQVSFIRMGLMTQAVALESAIWDYATLATGLKNTKVENQPKFNTQKVTARVAKELEAEANAFAEDGTLFVKEIYFQPNQKEFTEQDYAADFKEALKIIQTYNGALVVIEGHADPEGIRRARVRGEREAVLEEMEQKVKNLSYQRSRAVLESFSIYCQKAGIKIDESQFVPAGLGVKIPKFKEPRNKDEWKQNMRVVFRIKQIEAELQEFTPEKSEK